MRITGKVHVTLLPHDSPPARGARGAAFPDSPELARARATMREDEKRCDALYWATRRLIAAVWRTCGDPERAARAERGEFRLDAELLALPDDAGTRFVAAIGRLLAELRTADDSAATGGRGG